VYFWDHALPRKQVATIVAKQGRYLGIMRVSTASDLERTEWSDVTVGEVMDDDVEPARLSWTLREATVAMENHDLDVLAVVDAHGEVVGVVTADDILKLEELLEETG
jgi:CBS-domain-containing membrane protein